jgi:hypothetical protein
MLANKKWYNDTRYPAPALMGLESVTLTARSCTGLVELGGHRISAVYIPPSGAVRSPSGTGYRIGSGVAGVVFEVDFPDGKSHPDGGILLAAQDPSESQTVLPISGIINLASGRTFIVKLTISLVKTGDFGPGYGNVANDIKLPPDGLGSLQYYSITDTSKKSNSINVMVFPASYGGTHSYWLAAVGTPTCRVFRLGDAWLTGGPASPGVIRLPSVNNLAFSGPGATDSSSDTRPFIFQCHGTDLTHPEVYFDANYPLDGGVNGVGMPSANSDIGIQILFNNGAVKFGVNSLPLQWSKNPYSALYDPIYGWLEASGRYCLKDCGTSMSGANWIDGGVGYGTNEGFEANVTFKYYQTTSKRPAPGQFSVPFTVTLDLP